MRHKLVTIVENDEGMLKALERLLRAHGYEVALFSTAEAFLESRAKYDASCVLLDIHLGGISGIQLRKMLERTRAVIFMTAFDKKEIYLEAVAAGCVAYLLKPFSAKSLLDALDEANHLRRDTAATATN